MFLNDIRWGIYVYLRPEFERSFYWDEDKNEAIGSRIAYGYRVPRNIKSQFARNCYWELMNEVRSSPDIKRFAVWKHLKSKY